MVFKVWKISWVLETISWTVSWPILHKLAVFRSLDAWDDWVVLSAGVPDPPLPEVLLVLLWELLIESLVFPFGGPEATWELGWEATGTVFGVA